MNHVVTTSRMIMRSTLGTARSCTNRIHVRCRASARHYGEKRQSTRALAAFRRTRARACVFTMFFVHAENPRKCALTRLCNMHRQSVLCFGILSCLWVTIISVTSYYDYTKQYNGVLFSRTTVQPIASNEASFSSLSSVSQRKVPISCFIITLNTSLAAVRLSPELTCHPYVGSRVTDAMFALVSGRVQNNLLKNTSAWGADFTNNQSISIAYNHVQLWRRLAKTAVHSDMLIFEDDIVLEAQVLVLYDKIRRSGVLPRDNYILKFTNRHRMQWLGGSELRPIYKYSIGSNQFALLKCVCRTRQNFFSSAAYVIDRQAARVLLEHHLPFETHIDIFMHYVGCSLSNFFLLDKDALRFSGRSSTHNTVWDESHRILAAFKEQIRNMIMTSCY